MKEFLQSAYMHPVFNGDDDSDNEEMMEELVQEPVLVQTKRRSKRNTPLASKQSNSSGD